MLAKALNKMRKSDNPFQVMIDAIPTMAWCSLPDGSVEFLNQRWHDYTGLSPEEAHGWVWKVTIHPEDLARLMDKWQALPASGEAGEIEARLRRFDGEFRWFLFRGSPLRDQSGGVVKWYGTNTDLEDRKRAEEALHASEHDLRLIIDSIPGFVWTDTAASEIELVNQPYLNYLGKTLEEVKDWPTALHSEDRVQRLGRRTSCPESKTR